MKDFIELTSTSGSKVIVNVHTIQAIYPDLSGTIIYLLKGGINTITVTEKYEDLLHVFIPTSKPVESKPKKVAKGVIVR